MLASGGPPPTDVQSLVAKLSRVVENAAGANRDVALARQAVFAEAAGLPGVRDEIERARDHFAAWMTPALLRSGSTDVATHHRVLLAMVDGLITRRLVAPAESLDPATAIQGLIRGLLDQPTQSAQVEKSSTASSQRQS